MWKQYGFEIIFFSSFLENTRRLRRRRFLSNRPATDIFAGTLCTSTSIWNIDNRLLSRVEIVLVFFIDYLRHEKKPNRNYLVPDTLVSGCLNDNGHLLGKLHGGDGSWSVLSHIHGSYPDSSLAVFGSVIHVNACVIVTNHTSGLRNRNLRLVGTTGFRAPCYIIEAVVFLCYEFDKQKHPTGGVINVYQYDYINT